MSNRAKTQRRNRAGRFADEGKPAVSAATTPKSRSGAVALVDNLLNDPHEDVRYHAACNPNLTAEQLIQLSTEDDWLIRTEVAKNTNTPPEALAVLANNVSTHILSSGVRRAVAENTNTPPEVLATLAKDDDSSVCEAACRNPNTPPGILAEVGKLESGFARGNPNASDYARGNPSNPNWRQSEASKAEDPDTPSELLARFAESQYAGIRRRAASNPSTPADAFKRLLADKERDVVDAAISGPNCDKSRLEAFARSDDRLDRWAAAANPNCPVSTLDWLATDPDDHVRRSVASNPNADQIILDRVAENWPSLCTELVENPNTNLAVIEEFADSAHWPTRWSIAQREDLPERLMRKLAHTDKETANLIASRPDCPPDLLEALSKDRRQEVRFYVGANPATPKELLTKMAKGSRMARMGVARNPAAGHQPPTSEQ